MLVTYSKKSADRKNGIGDAVIPDVEFDVLDRPQTLALVVDYFCPEDRFLDDDGKGRFRTFRCAIHGVPLSEMT
jgi:hypothetical protein